MNKIKNRLELLNDITSWSDKYNEIKNIKDLIKKRKELLIKNKEMLECEINESSHEFDDFDLDKVINQINKNNSIVKQVKSLIYLKEWFITEKSKVIKKNDN